MAQAVNLTSPPLSRFSPSTSGSNSCRLRNLAARLRCNTRISCLFDNNRKQEQAKKALESALGGNKEKFEKWNREIKKREEAGGGGGAGGGGWFGWGGRFGWFNGDNFWREAQQLILTLLGIIVLYLVAAKGELLVAVIFNPLLSALRTTRNAFAYIMSRLTGKSCPASDAKLADAPTEPAHSGAKSRVMKKWGSD